VINTPFENLPALNPWREHRLYQAFYLFRDYKFDLEDLQFTNGGNLTLEKDPKLTWAEGNLIGNPVEINKADYAQLLRIPGIGPVTAKKIIEKRLHGNIGDIVLLRKLGVPIDRAARFILLNGRKPAYQPGLF
jgi:predicted DNA-binding helix-hairpin-helix protein